MLKKTNESTTKSQDAELAGLQRTIQDLKKEAKGILEVDAKGRERLAAIQEQLKDKQRQCDALKDSNAKLETEAKMSAKQVLDLESAIVVARREHNVASKALLAERQKVAEVKALGDNLSRQSRAAREEIARLERLLIKERASATAVDKEIISLGEDVVRLEERSAQVREEQLANASVIKGLEQDIDKTDDLRESILRSGRNDTNLTIQLVAANREFAQLNERLQVDRHSLEVVQGQLTSLDEEIESGNLQTAELTNAKEARLAEKNDQTKKRELLFSLQRDLSYYLDKNKALASELDRPVSMHRWRYLQITDPEKWDLLNKANGLQCQVVSVNDAISDKTRELGQMWRKMMDLEQEAGDRQGAEEVVSKLSTLREKLRGINKDILAKKADLQLTVEETEMAQSAIEDLEKQRA